MPKNSNTSSPSNLKLTRRSFIQYSTAITGGMMLNPLMGYSTPGKSASENLYWYQKPVRIMHTVLREIDAKNYDADAVVDYLQKGGYNALCVNAGGIVDFFQNPLPAGNINRFMGDRDILKEITSVCQKANIKVIARVDFRGVEEHVYKKFPDWFMKDPEQNPIMMTYTKPELYPSCYTNKHRNEYANEYISYVLKNYQVDGIWHNSPGFEGICHCHTCQKAYLDFSGNEIPLMDSASDKELDTYMDWKRYAADGYMHRIKKTIKTFGNDKVYTAEVFSIYDVGKKIDWGIDFSNARDHFDILVSVAFLTGHGADKYYFDLNYGSTIIKFLKSMVPEREAVVMYGGNGTSHRLVADPSIDLNIWLWQILSAGGRFWNCYFSNVPTLTHDNRNAFNETEIYQFVKNNEQLLEQHAPVANVGIYYSNPTRMSYREESIEGDAYGNEIRGIETVLMENHIPHDFILDDQISEARLQKYDLVILPNVRCMSDKEVELLKEYVASGGNLIGTYISSLMDADGTERKDYGLSELFGVSYLGKRENTRTDNYQYILNKEHPIVEADSGETELLFNAGFTALCKPIKDSEVICTLVPTIHNQPPDKSWVDEFSTEYPTIVSNQYGRGKVMYFANQPDRLSHEIGHADPRNLLLRSIRYLAGESLPIETDAPPSVNIGLTESLMKPGHFILSMVNTTSGPVRPVRQLVPVQDINVKLRLNGKTVKSHKVLRCQGECGVKTQGQHLHLQISELGDYFAIHIQMNG